MTTGVLAKGGNLEIDRHTGRTPCEDEGREPQAKKHQRLPGNTRSWERGLEQAVPPRPQEKAALLTPCSQTSGLQNRDNKSPSLKSLSLQHFATAAPANEQERQQ